MIKKIEISNYKSIKDIEFELSSFNVFIGENGSGKSNILEAVAMHSASKTNELNPQGLYNKGVRVTKPALTFSSFLGEKPKNQIETIFYFDNDNEQIFDKTKLIAKDIDDIYSLWVDKDLERDIKLTLERELVKIIGRDVEEDDIESLINPVYRKNMLSDFAYKMLQEITPKNIQDFLIYSINTQNLRGISNESKKTPLGIFGEGLDVLLANFDENEWNDLMNNIPLISWLEDIFIDEKDSLKFEGHKMGRSSSYLYFKDKFMRKNNNIFSAENANEGALHILFYLALFISKKTPDFFAVDNIETALNPKLLRTLIKISANLAKKNNKQVLITTHNPATLDGLNLHDENQRLFVVKRNDKGHTTINRIKLKPQKDRNYKLSEMWQRGFIGGLPNNF